MVESQDLQGHRYSSVCTEILHDAGTDEVTRVYTPASTLHVVTGSKVLLRASVSLVGG